MRRTNQEFRDEILRRESEYRTRQKQRRRKLLSTVVCVILVIFGGAMTLPFLSGMGASSENMADMAPEQKNYAYDSPQEAPAAVEGDMNHSSSGSDDAWDLVPMVRVDGILYLETGYYNGEDRKCGTYDGEITSMVDGSQIPAENDQSNFGIGYGYQYGEREGTVEIYMNGKWRIFATEEARQQIQFPE